MVEFESWNFLKWMYKHFKALLIVQVITLALSIVFSSPYFIPKEYKSYTTVYPANIVDYSEESPSEQMIEFLNSVDIKNAVIEKFDLKKHYFENKKISFAKLYREFDRNVIISPTLFRAVEIEVSDINPDTAYKMVNYILQVLDKKILQVQEEKALEVAKMWKTQVDLKENQIDSMVTAANILSKQYGLVDYDGQSREVSKAYWTAVAAGKNPKQLTDLTQQINNLENYGIKFKIINQHIQTAVDDENLLGVKYEDAMKEVNKRYTYYNLVSAPYKADSPYYPLRILIVLLSCASGLIFSILFMRTIEKIRN